MLKGEILYKHVKIKPDTPIYKLGVVDMLRAIVEQLNYDPAARFKSADTMSDYMNGLTANLIEFLLRSIEPIKKGNKVDALALVDSGFMPVYESVKNSKTFEPYYNFQEVYPDTIYPGVPYTIRVYITKKQGN